ncbi:MAG: xanthine dehydrogenase family protein molybdopterin-binding subunit [Armatimonadetes bacterium]|nr:xanthine dehydrogenase family protein molybdopterin-binding subunit [Armatimonadota bacterium]
MSDEHRDELRSQPLYAPRLGRRGFLQAAGGIAVLCTLPGEGQAQRGRGGPESDDLSIWLHIDEQGAVTVYTGKVELGQNIRTVLAQVVAEELHLKPQAITLVMGDTDRVPFDQGTFGSRTTPGMVPVLRRAGAAARELLFDLAAKLWAVDRAGLTLADGVVEHKASRRKATLGQLTHGEKLVHSIASAATTPPERWQVNGRPLRKLNGREIVTGTHRYPSDIARPGMLHGKVVRPAGFGSKLTSVDTAAAEAMPGVTVLHDGDFLAVAAPDEHLAQQAAAAIKVEWTAPAGPSDSDLPGLLRAKPAAPTQAVADALATAEVKLEASYTIAYIQHIPLEPRAAVAEWGADGRLTVWTGTQRPFGVKQELTQHFGLQESQVHVLMPDLGSGYGGKHSGDAALEAARLAKAAGKPVKVIWTREEEFTWAYFRPCGVIDVTAGARPDGTLVAWEMHNYNSGGAGLDTAYDVAAKHVQQHGGGGPLRQGSYRGLAGPANFFARETAMDELAVAAALDPLAFRLKNLTHPRLRGVLEAAARKFGWEQAKAGGGRGFGIACGTEKGSFVATAAEVAVSDAGEVKVVRVVTAFDCGVVNNPDAVLNQCEGMISMASGGALFEHIRFAGGKILNPRLSEYRVPRFSDWPEAEFVLVEGDHSASAGAGETPMMALAPALGNAIFRATGTRLRSMPLAPEGVPSSAG